MSEVVQSHVDGQPPSDTEATPDWLSSMLPEVDAARRRLAAAAMAPDGALPLRLKEIVAVVILAYTHDPAIEVHMRRALAAGATVREIVEGIMAASTPGGQPCLHHAMPYLKNLIAELGEKANIRPAPGEVERARTFRHSTQAKWDWIEEHYPEYQELRRKANRILLMPEDASLAPRYREVMAAVVLARRAYPTVPHHLRRAVEEGATFDELVEAMQVGALLGGAPLLQHAWPHLVQIHDEIAARSLGPR
jgi:alkylhydroperoxidase/carboxymuconolactone decarboxylase family protein YurZ